MATNCDRNCRSFLSSACVTIFLLPACGTFRNEIKEVPDTGPNGRLHDGWSMHLWRHALPHDHLSRFLFTAAIAAGISTKRVLLSPLQ